MSSKYKIILAIRSLNLGGAERQFLELVKYIDKNKFYVYVCTMYGGILEDEIQAIHDVHYTNLHKKGRYDLFPFFMKYRSYLASIQPDVIYSFLPEMNLFSFWCKPKKTKIIWGIRASNMHLKHYGMMAQLLFIFQKYCSPYIHCMIANARESIAFYKSQNFEMSHSDVIYNGIDTQRFSFLNEHRVAFRERYSIASNQIVVALVARYDVMKGYSLFVRVANRIMQEREDMVFVAIGSGNEQIKESCNALIADECKEKFLWIQATPKVENLYSGFDILCSTSLFGEGFSNVIAEAMSCEVPCIVTDVGDSKMIVGECGMVIPPNDEQRLYEAIMQMIQRDRQLLGKLSRNKIVREFSLQRMVDETQNIIYKTLHKSYHNV